MTQWPMNMSPSQHMAQVPPAAPQAPPQAPPLAPPPSAEQLNASVRRSARAAHRWAVAGCIALILRLVALWLGYNDSVLDLFHTALIRFSSTLFFVIAVVFASVMALFVGLTLQALKRRALWWSPPLDRDVVSLTTMHTWPVRSITGPVVVLAETGVAGIGRYVWFAACALWPVGIVWAVAGGGVFAGDSALVKFQSGVVLCLAFMTTSLSARLLSTALEPDDRRRRVAVNKPKIEPGFWSRGLMAAGETERQENVLVTPPLDDSIDRLYIKKIGD